MDSAFRQQIKDMLDALPSKWADQLATILCQIKEDKESVDCNKVKECETVTSMSDFTVSGTTVSIKYTDENGTQVTRSFDAGAVVNGTLDDLDPNCLASPEEWNSLSYDQRIQLLIDAHCACCGFNVLLIPQDELIDYNDCVPDPGTGGDLTFEFETSFDVDDVTLVTDPYGGSIVFTAPRTIEYTLIPDVDLGDLSNSPPIVRITVDAQEIYLPLQMINEFTQCE
jgi:hypothetical protein